MRSEVCATGRNLRILIWELISNGNYIAIGGHGFECEVREIAGNCSLFLFGIMDLSRLPELKNSHIS
jgi:hypothetical protein